MMRSLWTAASAMTSQQLNIDTISNNLANVNTHSYKKERLEFKSLMYETMKRADLDRANQSARPANLQVGHGVLPIAVSRNFEIGNFERTDNKSDFAIEGDGFFVVRTGEDDYSYTKDGAFKLAISDEGITFVTSDGYQLMNIDDEAVLIPNEVKISDLNISEDGTISYINEEGESTEIGSNINIVQFQNPQGLEAVGKNLYRQTSATGDALRESDGQINKISRIRQGTLEMSNVKVAEEMIKLIVAQRAYEVGSKAIQTSDDMLQTANNLKR